MLSLLVVFLVAAAAASLANAAVYEWAWDRRRLSPWQPTPAGVARRTAADCIPVYGWLRLRRDSKQLGRGFWIRPLLVELAFAGAIAALYWWECEKLGLIAPQFLGRWPGAPADLWTVTFSQFVMHALLAWLMLVASLIDIDEKTIPDEVTLPGTLLGLLLAIFLGSAALPNVENRLAKPAAGVEVFDLQGQPLEAVGGGSIYVEPVHLAAPNDWPLALAGGAANQGPLWLGLGCYVLWCFALTNRILRLRRGLFYGLAILLQRVGRELTSRPLREILLAGLLTITCVWYTGGAAWQGLLTALVGMIVAGSIVWAVRIVGSLALGREAMGFGDVTLMFMVGAFLGWQSGLMIFFLAPFAALGIGLIQLLLRSDDVIPYGPFLCAAAAALVVRWADLWTRSENLFAMGTVVPAVLILCVFLLGFLLAVWRQIKLRVLGMSEDWDEQ